MNFLPLHADELECIHRAGLKLLGEVGLTVMSGQAADLFKQAGASVSADHRSFRVRLSQKMVEEALKTVPKSFTIHARENGHACRFQRGFPPLFGPSGVPHLIWDEKAGQRREATLEDYIASLKLLDGLSQVDFISSPCTFSGLPEQLLDLATVFYLADTTRKPFSVDFSGESGFKEALLMVELLKERVYHGKPFIQFGFCPVMSPLRFDRMGIDQLIDAVRAGIPVAPATMAQTGVNGPATLAGTIVLMNAEILALIALIQIARPGAPMLYVTIPGTTNFRTAEMLTASPESALLNAGATQMADYYGLPNWATAGRTDSKTLDIQAGYEQAFSVPLVALSGATYISAIGGFLQSVNALAFEKFVIDNEIAAMTRRVLAGINTDEDSCAVDLIAQVGPGGNYLGERHTLRYMQTEFFSPEISENSYWEHWQSIGKPSALDKARTKAAAIVASHRTPHLPKDVVQEMQDAVPMLREILSE